VNTGSEEEKHLAEELGRALAALKDAAGQTLFGRQCQQALIASEAELAACKANSTTGQKDLEACMQRKKEASVALDACKGSASGCESTCQSEKDQLAAALEDAKAKQKQCETDASTCTSDLSKRTYTSSAAGGCEPLQARCESELTKFR